MSAFLFVKSSEKIKASSTEDLEKELETLNKLISTVKFEELDWCTYEFDLNHGRIGTIAKIKRELENRKTGQTNSIAVLVPGYNPPDDG